MTTTDTDNRVPTPAPDGRAMWRLGLVLFLASLTVFFVGALVVYIFTAVGRPPLEGVNAHSLPSMMWFSTLLLLLSGLTIEAGARLSKRARMAETARWLTIAATLGILFVLTQTVAISQLMGDHQLERTRPVLGLSGLTFVMILIHALHVVGGLIPLAILVHKARNSRLSLEHIPAVRGCATYWHFLEVVWLTMFLIFWITTRSPVG